MNKHSRHMLQTVQIDFPSFFAAQVCAFVAVLNRSLWVHFAFHRAEDDWAMFLMYKKVAKELVSSSLELPPITKNLAPVLKIDHRQSPILERGSSMSGSTLTFRTSSTVLARVYRRPKLIRAQGCSFNDFALRSQSFA